MSQIHRNIVANMAGRAWSFISVFVFVPFYLKLLGAESYGMIGFSVVILGFLSFMDVGLSATLQREFARSDRSQQYKANLLRSAEYVFFCLVVIISVSIWLLSPVIATKWLNITSLSLAKGTMYLRMIGFVVAFQMFANIYQSALIGMQKQVASNVFLIGFGAFRSGLVLLPLFFCPILEVFFSWQIATTLLYLLLLRQKVYSFVPCENRQFSWKILQEIWKYASGMMAMSILSAALIQSDKMITSALFPLKEFGYYSIGAQLAQLPMMLILPFGIAIYPKIIELLSQKRSEEMWFLFRKLSVIIVLLSSIVTGALLIFMPLLLSLWTHDQTLTDFVTPVARILVLGSLGQTLQLMPYYLGLANGHTKTNVIMGVFSVGFVVPALFIFIRQWGLIGAGIPWLIMSIVSFVLLSFIIFSKFTVSKFKLWIIKDTLYPLTLVGICWVICLVCIERYSFSVAIDLIMLFFSICLSFVVAILFYLRRYPEDRNVISNYIKR